MVQWALNGLRRITLPAAGVDEGNTTMDPRRTAGAAVSDSQALGQKRDCRKSGVEVQRGDGRRFPSRNWLAACRWDGGRNPKVRFQGGFRRQRGARWEAWDAHWTGAGPGGIRLDAGMGPARRAVAFADRLSTSRRACDGIWRLVGGTAGKATARAVGADRFLGA